MQREEYEQNVFINCPFDSEYAPIFEAIVFAVNDAGFRPKCARERLDSSQIRFQKIVSLISASRYSIHDLSRTSLDTTSALPRFNMPLELGIDLGCKEFNPNCSDKSLLIFDSEQYRFQKFIFGSRRPGYPPARQQSPNRGDARSKLATRRIR